MMRYNGTKFSSKLRGKLYKSQQEAAVMARSLIKRYPVLRTLELYVSDV